MVLSLVGSLQRSILQANAMMLKRYNVIVAEAFEQTMGEILSNMDAICTRGRRPTHKVKAVKRPRTFVLLYSFG